MAIATLAVLVLSAGSFVAYVLWPRWPSPPVPLDAPAIPITVAGVLFEVPPAAIRTALQRHPGPHERIDLAFAWPSLTPPQPELSANAKPLAAAGDVAVGGQLPEAGVNDRLFVTIAALGSVLPPIERLRTIYPRYVATQASTDASGLAIQPFRAATPYDGEDLIYAAATPDRFFARCTREFGSVPGTCIHERTIDAAEVTFRFPRAWLGNWQNIAAGFDRLMGELHPPGR